MSKKNNQSQPSQSYDFFQNLVNNPMPSPANSSSAPQTSNPSPSNMAPQTGFSSFAINPFSQQFYNQTGFPPVAPHFYNPQQYGQFQHQFQNQFQHQAQYQNVETPPDVEVEGEGEADVEVEVDADRKGKRKQTRWTNDEAMILAQRWVGASENPVQGNSQSDEAFWKTIATAYNSLVDVKRNKNQLTGKWNKIRGDVKLFGGIFRRHSEQNRQSGSDEKAVYDAAHRHFKQQTGRSFIYESCWHVLKDYPKFWNDFGVGSHKRQFQDEPIRLDEDEPTADPTPTPNPNPRMEALFRDDPIRRPPGRDFSRKSQKSASSSDATSSRISSEEARLEVTQTARVQQKTLKTIEEAVRQKEVIEAFKFLQTPIPDGLSRKDRKRIVKAREKLWAKYADEFGGDDDDDDDDDEDDE